MIPPFLTHFAEAHWQVIVTVASILVTILTVISAHRRLEAVAVDADWNISDAFTEWNSLTNKRELTPRRIGHMTAILVSSVAVLRLTWSANIGDGMGIVALLAVYFLAMMFPETFERTFASKFSGSTTGSAAPKSGG